MVATCAPFTPGVEDLLNGSVSCQHSNVEALFFVTIAVAVKYVVLSACAMMVLASNEIKNSPLRDCMMMDIWNDRISRNLEF